jgi:hypothetical protein
VALPRTSAEAISPHNHLHRIGSVAELNGFLSVGDETINSVDDEAAMAERGHRLSPQVKLAALGALRSSELGDENKRAPTGIGV